MLTKRIVKKGCSNFVLIPKDFLDNLELVTGDTINMKLENSKIIIVPKKKGKE